MDTVCQDLTFVSTSTIFWWPAGRRTSIGPTLRNFSPDFEHSGWSSTQPSAFLCSHGWNSWGTRCRQTASPPRRTAWKPSGISPSRLRLRNWWNTWGCSIFISGLSPERPRYFLRFTTQRRETRRSPHSGETAGLPGVESPARQSHAAGPFQARRSSSSYHRRFRLRGGGCPGAGGCRTMVPAGFLQLPVQTHPHRAKPAPSTGRRPTERNRAGVTGRVPVRAALPAPPGRPAFHVVHGPPAPGGHDGKDHRPEVGDAGPALGLHLDLYDGRATRRGKTECRRGRPLPSRDQRRLPGGQLPGPSPGPTTRPWTAGGSDGSDSAAVAGCRPRRHAVALRHLGSIAPAVGTGTPPPPGLRPAAWAVPPWNPGLGSALIEPLCVARPQPWCDSLGTRVRCLPASKGAPAHQQRGRPNSDAGQQLRGDPRRPRGTPHTLARQHPPSDHRGPVHQVARGSPHPRHDHPGSGESAHRLLGLPFRDTSGHHLGQRPAVRVPAMDGNRPALGRRAEADDRLPSPIKWDGRAVPPPAQGLPHRPAHRTQLGQPASVGPTRDPHHPQGGHRRIAGRVGLWDRAPPPGPVPGSGRGQPRSGTLLGGFEEGHGRAPAHPHSAPPACRTSPNEAPRGTPHLPDGIRSPWRTPGTVVNPLWRSLPSVSEGGQVFPPSTWGTGRYGGDRPAEAGHPRAGHPSSPAPKTRMPPGATTGSAAKTRASSAATTPTSGPNAGSPYRPRTQNHAAGRDETHEIWKDRPDPAEIRLECLGGVM